MSVVEGPGHGKPWACDSTVQAGEGELRWTRAYFDDRRTARNAGQIAVNIRGGDIQKTRLLKYDARSDSYERLGSFVRREP